jgi:hypothetical protein
MLRKMAGPPGVTRQEAVAALRKELSKISMVQNLVRREQGATLAEKSDTWSNPNRLFF